MFQFRKQEAAVQAARVLAAGQAEPVLIMVRMSGQVFSIGVRTNAALHGAGRPVATVYSSGHVEYVASDGSRTHECLIRTHANSPTSRCC